MQYCEYQHSKQNCNEILNKNLIFTNFSIAAYRCVPIKVQNQRTTLPGIKPLSGHVENYQIPNYLSRKILRAPLFNK